MREYTKGRYNKPRIVEALTVEAGIYDYPDKLVRSIRQLSGEVDRSLSGKMKLSQGEAKAIFEKIEEVVLDEDSKIGISLRRRGIDINVVLNARERILGG